MTNKETASESIQVEVLAPYLTPERPDFGPTQVKDAGGLKVDRRYILHSASNCLEMGHEEPFGRNYNPPLEITVTEIFREGNLAHEEGYVNFTYRVSMFSSGIHFQSSQEGNMPLLKAGLADDGKGNWHKYNWIEDFTKKSGDLEIDNSRIGRLKTVFSRNRR
jgi:hypothetical protein